MKKYVHYCNHKIKSPLKNDGNFSLMYACEKLEKQKSPYLVLWMLAVVRGLGTLNKLELEKLLD